MAKVLFSLFGNLLISTKLLLSRYLAKMAIALGFRKSIESIIFLNKKTIKNQEIERILRDFPNDKINALDWDTGDETEAADEILINNLVDDSDKRYDMSKNLAQSMRQIRGYQKLCMKVEARRLEHYDSFNKEDEAQLLKLWSLLMPDMKLQARKTNQWQDIGFQGNDPATDFRGMGMLGLDQLIFFAQFDVDNCKKVFTISQHPRWGFPFAICGIAITAMVKELLFDELLKNHFYNVFRESPTMDNFHQVYCCVFKLFANFWEVNEPETVMEFNPLRQKFVDVLEIYLQRPDANLIDATLEKVLDIE